FLTVATAISLTLVVLPGYPESAQAQTATSTRRFPPPPTLTMTRFYEAPTSPPPGKPGELVRSEPNDQYNLPYELSAVRILYHSRTAIGEDVAVSGVVLIPD